MHKHCFIDVAFIVCPLKLCILRDHEKRNYQKRNTGIAIFGFILEFEEKTEENVLTYIYVPPYGISFYLRNVLYCKE